MDTGFDIPTLVLLLGVNFRLFGAIFAPKTMLVTVSSDTATTRRRRGVKLKTDSC